MQRFGRPGLTMFVLAGTVIALFLAGFLSYYASAQPDGLVSTAMQVGFSDTAQEHARGGATFAGYTTTGVENDRLSGAIAGVVGVTMTMAVASLLFLVVRRRGAPTAPATSTDRVSG